MKKKLFITLLMAVMMPVFMMAQNNASTQVILDTTVCDSYTWSVNGTTYSASTTQALLQNDTLFVLNLIVNNNTANTIAVSACSYSWKNATIVRDTTLVDHFTNAQGCDSALTINFTKVTTYVEDLTTVACAKLNWHGMTFTRDTVISAMSKTNTDINCDSTLSLNLTIINPAAKSSDTVVSGCTRVFFSFGSGFPELHTDVNQVFSTEDYIGEEGDAMWSRFHGRGTTQEQCFDSVKLAHINVYYKVRTNVVLPPACEYTTFSGSYTVDTNTVEYSRTYTSTGTDSVKVGLSSHGCDSIALLSYTIYRNPIVSINGDININPGQTATLYAVCDQENVAYKWGEGETTDTITTRVLTENTDFSLEATNRTTNCKTQTSITVMVNEGIAEAEMNAVRLYPNPTSAKLNLDCVDAIDNLCIYNTVGQRVMNSYNMAAQSSLDLSSLANGTYTLRIQLRNGDVVVRNFVVTK